MENPNKIIEKLEAALNQDGDFPVRARVVSELRKLVNDEKTSVEKVVELILGEPALGTRVLHLVNSVYYQRSTPVMTVSQAVIQLGMRALSDLCTGLVLLRRFSPMARRGGIFADNVKKCIITSLMTSKLSRAEIDEAEERGYLAGTFFSIGPLLLAYYFPQVFESAEERAKRRGKTTSQSIAESLGIAPVALSLGIVDALSIPQYYKDLLIGAYSRYVDESPGTDAGVYDATLENALATSGKLADAVIDTHTRPELSSAIDKISESSGFSREALCQVLAHLPVSFVQHCQTIEMPFLELPEHFISFIETKDGAELKALSQAEEDKFGFYAKEIKEAISNEESMSSIVTSAMEALAFGLKFERVLLLFSDPRGQVLQAKMVLGKPFPVDTAAYKRSITNDPESPDTVAFTQGTVEIFGEPLFEDGWPFAAVPIGSTNRCIGVIYADLIAKTDSAPLTDGVQVGLNMLADLLERALSLNS